MASRKVTMLGPFPPITGGVSDYCFSLARGIAKIIPVEFYTYKDIYPKFLYRGGELYQFPIGPTSIVSEGVDLKRVLSWKNPFGWLRASLENKGEVLHFQWWTFYLFFPTFSIALLSKLRKKKIVCTVHNVLGHESGFLDRFFSSLIFLLPDKFIVHSEQNKEQLLKIFNIPRFRIEVVPMGIFDIYDGEGVSKRSAREKFGIPSNAKVVLFFGTIRKYKGLEDLVQAFKISRENVGNLFLLVAGKPWDQEIEQNISASLAGISGKKLMLDYVPREEIKFLFAASDLTVLPYRDFNSQSAVGSTALYFSKPMIVSDAGGLPELVPSRESVFKAGDINALAGLITRVFSQKTLLQSMAKDCEKLKHKYSWENVCERTIRLYESLSG